jgi:hypothetical protein
MGLITVRIMIMVLKPTFILQNNCEDFVYSLRKLFPARLRGKFIDHKFLPTGLTVRVKVASLVELNPYLCAFVGSLRRAGEKLTLSVHSGHRKYLIIGDEYVSSRRAMAGRHQPLRPSDPASARRSHRKVEPPRGTVPEIMVIDRGDMPPFLSHSPLTGRRSGSSELPVIREKN